MEQTKEEVTKGEEYIVCKTVQQVALCQWQTNRKTLEVVEQ